MAAVSEGNRLVAILRDTVVGLVRDESPDLTARQLGVLLVCHLEDGPHTVRGLAKRLDVPKPTITRVIDRLETLDLVSRAADPRDRRSILVARTAAGVAYVDGLRQLMRAAAGQGGGDLAAPRSHAPPDQPTPSGSSGPSRFNGRPSPAPGRRTPPP